MRKDTITVIDAMAKLYNTHREKGPIKTTNTYNLRVEKLASLHKKNGYYENKERLRKLFQYELFLDHPLLDGPSVARRPEINLKVARRPEINLKEYKPIWEILRLDKDKEEEEEEEKEVEDPTTKLPSQIGKVYLNKDEESKSDSDEDKQADGSEKIDLKM